MGATKRERERICFHCALLEEKNAQKSAEEFCLIFQAFQAIRKFRTLDKAFPTRFRDLRNGLKLAPIPLPKTPLKIAIFRQSDDSLLSYKLVIVPADYVMDEASAKAIREYVSSGGTVLMAAFSAKVDERGLWFSTPLPGRLSDVFGLGRFQASRRTGSAALRQLRTITTAGAFRSRANPTAMRRLRSSRRNVVASGTSAHSCTKRNSVSGLVLTCSVGTLIVATSSPGGYQQGVGPSIELMQALRVE